MYFKSQSLPRESNKSTRFFFAKGLAIGFRSNEINGFKPDCCNLISSERHPGFVSSKSHVSRLSTIRKSFNI